MPLGGWAREGRPPKQSGEPRPSLRSRSVGMAHACGPPRRGRRGGLVGSLRDLADAVDGWPRKVAPFRVLGPDRRWPPVRGRQVIGLRRRSALRVPVARTGSTRGSPVSDLPGGHSVTAPDPAAARGRKHTPRCTSPAPGRCLRTASTPHSHGRHGQGALGPPIAEAPPLAAGTVVDCG